MDQSSSEIFSGRGFTLMEIIVVLAVISILAVIALPSSTGKINRSYINESMQLVEPYQHTIAGIYTATGSFPIDNAAAGLPPPNLITGNYLDAVEVENGAMHLKLGQKITDKLKGKILSVRPVYVPATPGAPVSWICGYDGVPDRMQASANDRTDIDVLYLPIQCR